MPVGNRAPTGDSQQELLEARRWQVSVGNRAPTGDSQQELLEARRWQVPVGNRAPTGEAAMSLSFDLNFPIVESYLPLVENIFSIPHKKGYWDKNETLIYPFIDHLLL